MNLITPVLKDRALKMLIESGKMEGSFNMFEFSEELNTNPDLLDAVLKQFEKLELFSFEFASQGITSALALFQ